MSAYRCTSETRSHVLVEKYKKREGKAEITWGSSTRRLEGGVNIIENMTFDRSEWRTTIYISEFD